MARRRRRAAVIQDECLQDLRFWVETNLHTSLASGTAISAVGSVTASSLPRPETLGTPFISIIGTRHVGLTVVVLIRPVRNVLRREAELEHGEMFV